MSTILDALRKLQTEREPAARTGRELRSSVVEASYPPPRPTTPVRRGDRSFWVGSALTAGVVVVVAGLFVFWQQGGSTGTDPLERAATAPREPLLAQATPPPRPPARRESAPLAVPPSESASRPPTPPAPAPPPIPSRAPAAGNPRLLGDVLARLQAQTQDEPPADPGELQQRFAQLLSGEDSSAPARRVVPRLGGSRRPPSRNPVQPAPRLDRPPEINFRPPIGSSSGSAPETRGSSPMQEALERVLDSQPGRRSSRAGSAPSRVEIKRARPRTMPPPAPEEPAPRSLLSGPSLAQSEDDAVPAFAAETPGEVGFPELAVESVRWHPDAGRRRATVQVDDRRVEDAREGDLIEGVFIDRVEPGSVRFRIGSIRKRIDLGQ